MSGHVRANGRPSEDVLHDLRTMLRDRFGIEHMTLQVEAPITPTTARAASPIRAASCLQQSDCPPQRNTRAQRHSVATAYATAIGRAWWCVNRRPLCRGTAPGRSCSGRAEKSRCRRSGQSCRSPTDRCRRRPTGASEMVSSGAAACQRMTRLSAKHSNVKPRQTDRGAGQPPTSWVAMPASHVSSLVSRRRRTCCQDARQQRKAPVDAPRPLAASTPVPASTASAMTPTHAGSTWCSGWVLKPTSKSTVITWRSARGVTAAQAAHAAAQAVAGPRARSRGR